MSVSLVAHIRQKMDEAYSAALHESSSSARAHMLMRHLTIDLLSISTLLDSVKLKSSSNLKLGLLTSTTIKQLQSALLRSGKQIALE